jgi:hypothetical protein
MTRLCVKFTTIQRIAEHAFEILAIATVVMVLAWITTLFALCEQLGFISGLVVWIIATTVATPLANMFYDRFVNSLM